MSGIECRACRSVGPHREVHALGDPGPERETFLYFECGECASLSIASVPSNLADYYPSDYYSFAPYEPPGGVKGRLKALRDRVTLCGAGPLTQALRAVSRNADLIQHSPPFDGSAPRRYGRDSRVIDVGCGYGRPLREMHGAGFTALTG